MTGSVALSGPRRMAFVLLVVAGVSTSVVLGGEALVRLAVPDETFWPISNIYQASDVPDVLYTYRSSFRGTAFGVGLRTNGLGFRGDAWPVTPGNAVRIALIGDSHAFGFGVAFEETVGEVARRRLEARWRTPVEVLNFGVNGYNAGQQRAVLEHFALAHAPDLVVLMPANNDHKPALRADPSGWLHWDGDASTHRTRVRDRAIGAASARTTSWWAARSRLYQFVKLVHRRRGARDDPALADQDGPVTVASAPRRWLAPVEPGPVSARLAAEVHPALIHMLDLVAAHDRPVVLAPVCAGTDYRQMVQGLARARAIPVLELLGLFPEVAGWDALLERFGLGWDPHLGVEAHRRWGEALAELIVGQGWERPSRLREATS